MQPDTPVRKLTVDDVLFVLFRHKWMILACVTMGCVSAAAVYKALASRYTSEARLLVRYIVETPAALPPGSEEMVRQLDARGDSIMRTEMEILSSGDLARLVAEDFGPERLVGQADVSDPVSAAAGVIQGHLKSVSEANVISLSFTDKDPALCQPVLSEVIRSYLKFHTRIHQPPGNSETLAQDAAQEKLRLRDTENRLLELRAQMGGLSLADAKSAVASEIEMLRKALLEVESELAAREAISGTGASGPNSPQDDKGGAAAEETGMTNATPSTATSVSEAVAYTALTERLGRLRQREQEYLTSFTSENPMVKSVQSQIRELEGRIQAMVDRNPRLALGAVPTAGTGLAGSAAVTDFIPALKARMAVVKHQLEDARAESLQLSELERTFSDLQLSREIQQSNLRHMATTLEQSRYDSALQSANRSSIKVLQEPSDPGLNTEKAKKTAFIALVGFSGVGLALAFVLELFLDPRLKRAGQLEERTRLPVYISIPAFRELKGPRVAGANGNGRHLLKAGLLPANSEHNAAKPAAHSADPARSYYEALRDRLVAYFERVNLRRKPKLVGISACHSKAGVSSVVRGLAATLSEAGGGKVLLVDMNNGKGANNFQPFEKGRPVVGLPELLSNNPDRTSQDPEESLVLASVGESPEGYHPIRSHHFDSLIPKLKASDFDFIVFDMPPLTPTSVTFRVAGFLDKMLVVAESERTHMESISRAVTLLQESNAKIALVMNKTREYLPRWLRPPQ